jgi:hypothetical protein
MSLFINPALDAYRYDERIVSALNGITLLNLSEFNEWYTPVIKESDRIGKLAKKKGSAEEEQLLSRRKDIVNEAKNKSKNVLELLSDTVCLDPTSGQSSIDLVYGKTAVRRLLASNANFDMLVAIEPSTVPAGYSATVSQNKLNRVVGFIIAELGECRNQRDVWSVNLICTRIISSPSIKGVILLGAFVYCIKNSRYTKKGILELAGGYNNINGFISNTKMGFNKDLKLFKPDCFPNFNNLPMSLDISSLDNQTILNRAGEIERRVVTNIEDDSGLYSAGRINSSLQHTLIVCNDLLYRIQIAFNDIVSDPNKLHNPVLIQNFKRLLLLVGEDKRKMELELTKERRNILREINAKASAALASSSADDDDNCIQQCFKGICKCIGWKGGKKTRKLHKKRLNNKSYHKKSHRKHNKKTRKHAYRK